MDEVDRAILDVLQSGIPVTPEPYADMAKLCETTAEDVHSRVQRMRSEGVIRRFGAILDSRSLGMSTTLAAVDVVEESVEAVAAHLDSIPEVTHSYLREGHPNIWFTLVAASRDDIDRRMDEVATLPETSSAMELPATKVYKIGVRVRASSDSSRK